MGRFRENVGFWLLWSVVPFLGWVSWLQAAIQSQHWTYLRWSALYLATALPVFILIGISDDSDANPVPWPLTAIFFVAWVACFVQAVAMRKSVNTRIKYARVAKRESEPDREARIAAEYGMDVAPPTLPTPPRPPSVETRQPDAERSGAQQGAVRSAAESTPAGIPAELESKSCPDCGKAVRAAARVCRYCGFRWEESPSG